MRKRLITGLAVVGLGLVGARALLADDTAQLIEDSGIAPEIEYTICAQGVLRECGKLVQQSCTDWGTTSGGGGLNVAPGTFGANGSMTRTCATWTNIEVKLYKDKYKTKSTA